MELLHDDVVLEVRIPPEVEPDPVADFVTVKRLDLVGGDTEEGVNAACAREPTRSWSGAAGLTSRSVM